ncbi:hypothetical protein SLI_2628 [Streptomyces lividans 1326]|uniref:Uncharacterized protein n=1 Tax=Streptomyces lividans 1326 TaxID=1200984 RepID=A0A7U9HB32_STRLI|nr:hypothetical protein SLI_2628 [Streptomyces lividans 1326]
MRRGRRRPRPVPPSSRTGTTLRRARPRPSPRWPGGRRACCSRGGSTRTSRGRAGRRGPPRPPAASCRGA